MTAESKALVWGSGMIAFAPVACLFFQIVYPKSQLIIVVTTAAFFFLMSSVCAGFAWEMLDPIIGLNGPGSAIIPGVIFQFFFRCGFVAVYHKIEAVIEKTLDQSEQERQERGQRSTSTSNNNTAGGDATHDIVDSAKLKLELNDVSCGLAAGVGFGGMHAVLLYGTLLASEFNDPGDLYQPSCPYFPSLIVSAINCFIFFGLDIVWMFFTFFGMRRRLIFPRGGGTLSDLNFWRRNFGSYFGNTRSGGNFALLWVIIGHFVAAALTTLNSFEYGCTLSLPSLAAVFVVTAYAFWSGVSKIYLPLPHSTQRLTLPASFSYNSRAENALNGDEDEDGDGMAAPPQEATAAAVRPGASPVRRDNTDWEFPGEQPPSNTRGFCGVGGGRNDVADDDRSAEADWDDVGRL